VPQEGSSGERLRSKPSRNNLRRLKAIYIDCDYRFAVDQHADAVDMHLDLTDEEAAARLRELSEIIDNDRYQFLLRMRTLKAILAKLRPEPAREPRPLPKVYAPPRAKRRRGDAKYPAASSSRATAQGAIRR
jgi:hypothetical protein